MDSHEIRIKALERRVGRLHLMNGVLVVGVIGAGVALCGAFAAPPDPEIKTLTCNELRIVDKEGRLRIRAQAFELGQASVTWRDAKGNIRIAAGTFDNDDAVMCVRDMQGKERVAMESLASGESTARWSDASEKVRVGIGTFTNGRAGISVLDKKVKTARMSLVTDEHERVAAQFFDASGVERYRTMLTTEGLMSTNWNDAEGRARVTLGVGTAGEVLSGVLAGSQKPDPAPSKP